MPGENKIYTKGGDQGKTSLLGGTRVPKSHERIEAYGNLDELNSFIGLVRDQDILSQYRDLLVRIQKNLFITEAIVACDPEKETHKLAGLEEEEVTVLENEIDTMNNELSPLRNFIIPGGHVAVSYCHVARTICRRAERSLVRLNIISPVEPVIMRYLNRLSDYLFVLARKVGQDLGAEETHWKV